MQAGELPDQVDGGRRVGRGPRHEVRLEAEIATFPFYDEAGTALGSVDRAVTVGEQGMAELFEVEFSSTSMVGGYGYTLSG